MRGIYELRYFSILKLFVWFLKFLEFWEKYSQSQREQKEQAIIYSITELSQYLHEIRFRQVTDHQPLIAIFGEHK